MKKTEWFNLYGESWQGEIVPEAFSHPAKYSRALIRKIYQHMLAEGYIRPGDSIVDPFGGVALGALDCMRYGMNWYGIELEEKFVGLGQQNIDLWNGRYREWFVNWGTARLLQGDSRRLAQVLGEAAGCVSSPPYASSDPSASHVQGHSRLDPTSKNYRPFAVKSINDGYNNTRDYGRSPGQLGSMSEGDFDGVVASPPYVDSINNDRHGVDWSQCKKDYLGREFHSERRDMLNRHHNERKYGSGSGQLGAMKEGDLDGSISSPPYAETISKGDGPGVRHDPVHHNGDNATKNSSSSEYGRTEGQLGGMDGSIGSPPFENSFQDVNTTAGRIEYARGQGIDNCEFVSPIDMKRVNGRNQQYGQSSGQLGNDQGDTFWSAARVIVEQLYTALKPGAYAAFVTGDFVRNGQRVEFGRQWLQLCEACGFEAVEWIACWKREPGPVQVNAFGDDVDHTKDRVSFFRRLANQKNPDNAILNEDVIIVCKMIDNIHNYTLQ